MLHGSDGTRIANAHRLDARVTRVVGPIVMHDPQLPGHRYARHLVSFVCCPIADMAAGSADVLMLCMVRCCFEVGT